MTVRKCSCPSEFQDRFYGSGMRMHNKCAKGDRCTVCLNIKVKAAEEKPKKGEKAEKAVVAAPAAKPLKK